jgi:uncharacterized flavoprotein (TIGR03862 family)
MTDMAVIGAGPAGLMAAWHLAGLGHQVTVYDQMAAPARKFLLAGRSGLNLTHSENLADFIGRYGVAPPQLRAALEAFTPADLQAWAAALGEACFVGSSGRVFPRGFRATPLLRAWLTALAARGVRILTRHVWRGFDAAGGLYFGTPAGTIVTRPQAVLLALGGASWPRMGSTGNWQGILREAGVFVAPLVPSNCGVRATWSPVLLQKAEGAPLKRISVSVTGETRRGEIVITKTGLEGGPIYALAPQLRAALAAAGEAWLAIDLLPERDRQIVALQLDGARQGKSVANLLRGVAGLSPAAIAMVQEVLHSGDKNVVLSELVKALPVRVVGLAPIERAISCAGGIGFDNLDENFMLLARPGVFAAGEMLDWDAPTGGYLLQACFSTGLAAARGMVAYAGR